MKIINAEMMKNLSFPDFDIEKIEFNKGLKKLKIFIEGAWLDISGGQNLGKGTLFFDDWNEIEVRTYDHENEKWIDVDENSIEKLRDICETKFLNGSACLYGFSKEKHLWMECKISGSKMHAEFFA